MEIIETMSDDGETGFSRRNFIKGVIATGAAVSSNSYMFRGGTTVIAQSAAGSVDRLITLNVNGQSRRVDVTKQETLVMTLRYKLGLTGTKVGCDRAEMWQLHSSARRRAPLFMLGTDPQCSWSPAHDGRGVGAAGWHAAPDAAGDCR